MAKTYAVAFQPTNFHMKKWTNYSDASIHSINPICDRISFEYGQQRNDAATGNMFVSAARIFVSIGNKPQTKRLIESKLCIW